MTDWNPMRQDYGPPTLTLADFLLARIAEDEQRARSWYRARPGVAIPTIVRDGDDEWATWGDPDTFDGRATRFPVTDELREAWYENAPDARLLAECEAKRRIVELHKAEDRSGGWGAPADWRCSECGGRSAHPNLGWVPFAQSWPCPTLRLLALPYADHPAYQEEWRPID